MKEYTVYGTQDCHYCKEAKKLLAAKGLPCNYIDAPSSLFFKQNFSDKGIRKVPQIFVDEGSGERYIGGYEDLVKEIM